MIRAKDEVLLMAALTALEKAEAQTQFALRTLKELKRRNPAIAAGSRRAETRSRARFTRAAVPKGFAQTDAPKGE